MDLVAQYETYVDSGGEELAIPYPPGCIPGDLIIAVVALISQASPSFTIPTGWTQLTSISFAVPTDSTVIGMMRVYQEGDVGVHVAEVGTDIKTALYVFALRGARSIDPVADFDGDYAEELNIVNVPTLTPLEENNHILYYVTMFSGEINEIEVQGDFADSLAEVMTSDVEVFGDPLYFSFRVYLAEHTPKTAFSAQLSSGGDTNWTYTGLVIRNGSVTQFQDNYASKVARDTIPSVFARDLTSVMGKVVTLISTSDNEIGGLFGDEDFLPSEDL